MHRTSRTTKPSLPLSSTSWLRPHIAQNQFWPTQLVVVGIDTIPAGAPTTTTDFRPSQQHQTLPTYWRHASKHKTLRGIAFDASNQKRQSCRIPFHIAKAWNVSASKLPIQDSKDSAPNASSQIMCLRIGNHWWPKKKIVFFNIQPKEISKPFPSRLRKHMHSFKFRSCWQKSYNSVINNYQADSTHPQCS